MDNQHFKNALTGERTAGGGSASIDDELIVVNTDGSTEKYTTPEDIEQHWQDMKDKSLEFETKTPDTPDNPQGPSEDFLNFLDWVKRTGDTNVSHYYDYLRKMGNLDISGNLSDIIGDSIDGQQMLLDSLFSVLFGNSSSLSEMGTFYWDLLTNMYQTIQKSANNLGVDTPDERRGMAEQIMNMVYNFALAQYNNAYSQQTWLQQQEYNSPANQMQRYLDAGLNPIAFLGNIGNGNAESAAGVADPSQSDINSEKINGRLQKLQAVGDIVSMCAQGAGALTGMVSGAFDSRTAFLEGQRVKELTPLESQNLLDSHQINLQTLSNLRTAGKLSEKDLATYDERWQVQKGLVAQQTNTLAEQVANWRAQLEQQRDFFSKNMEFQRWNNERNRDTQVQVAGMNNATSRDIAQTQQDTALMLGNSTEQDVETYTDETGNRVNSASVQAGIRAGVLKVGADGSITDSKGHKKYSRTTIKRKRTPTSLQVLKNVIAGDINNRDSDPVTSSLPIMRNYLSDTQRMSDEVGKQFASYAQWRFYNDAINVQR